MVSCALTHIHTYTLTQMHSTHSHKFSHTHIHTRSFTHTHTHLHTHSHRHTNSHTHSHTHTNSHTLSHTRTHSHTHTLKFSATQSHIYALIVHTYTFTHTFTYTHPQILTVTHSYRYTAIHCHTHIRISRHSHSLTHSCTLAPSHLSQLHIHTQVYGLCLSLRDVSQPSAGRDVSRSPRCPEPGQTHRRCVQKPLQPRILTLSHVHAITRSCTSPTLTHPHMCTRTHAGSANTCGFPCLGPHSPPPKPP